MTSLDAQCLSAAAIVSKSMLDEAHWRSFGYRGRPRRGSLFQGWIGASRLERETLLMHELWGAGFGVICDWASAAPEFRHRVPFVAKLIEYSVDGLERPLWPALRFPARLEAIEFLEGAGQDYVGTTVHDRSMVFIRRCKEAISQQLPAPWLVGAAALFGHPSSLVFNAGLGLTVAGVAGNPESDIEMRDDQLLRISQRLLSQLERQTV